MRFVGDVGYVVTFRQIDPLYTVDLAVPERPRVLGELKIPGYSAYLHPVGDDLLLGVGQDVSEEGRPLGTQLSLFDVSDLRRPTRLHKASLGLGWSEAESDHHAFLYWPRTGLVVLPFEQRAVGFKVSRARDRRGRADRPRAREAGLHPGVRRSLVVRDSVLTVSDSGVKSSSLATLAERGWAAFPPPGNGAQAGPLRAPSCGCGLGGAGGVGADLLERAGERLDVGVGEVAGEVLLDRVPVWRGVFQHLAALVGKDDEDERRSFSGWTRGRGRPFHPVDDAGEAALAVEDPLGDVHAQAGGGLLELDQGVVPAQRDPGVALEFGVEHVVQRERALEVEAPRT